MYDFLKEKVINKNIYFFEVLIDHSTTIFLLPGPFSPHGEPFSMYAGPFSPDSMRINDMSEI